jgi:hypothetical protein
MVKTEHELDSLPEREFELGVFFDSVTDRWHQAVRNPEPYSVAHTGDASFSLLVGQHRGGLSTTPDM